MNQLSLRVLVADPQRAARQSMQRALETAGFSVQCVVTGADAIWTCEEDPPDILILELRLPDMDGFDVCSQVRRTTPNVDLMVIVTTSVVDDMTRAYLGPMVDFAGGDYFFAKPCDNKAMVKLLGELAIDTQELPLISPAPSPTHAVWPTGQIMPCMADRQTSSVGVERGRRPKFTDRRLPSPRVRAGLRSPNADLDHSSRVLGARNFVES